MLVLHKKIKDIARPDDFILYWNSINKKNEQLSITYIEIYHMVRGYQQQFCII